MAVLHNRISQKELKELLYQETDPRVTLSFYKYFHIDDPKQFRDDLYRSLHPMKVFGRIYVAAEGINAQVSVPEKNYEAFQQFIYAIAPLYGVRFNVAVDDDGKSFWVLKVKVRAKIVADGIDDPAFNMDIKGKYVNAAEFNAMAEDPDTVIMDMRNHYEYEVGHFEKAIPVPSDTFRDQLPMAVDMLNGKKENNIVIYCTGGIRCEKASAYLLHKGFPNVFHLEGGVINYANQVREAGLPNKFIGKNFVFDDRLGERITDEIIATCHQCGTPADSHTNCKNNACHLLFIQCAGCAARFNGCCSEACHQVYLLPPDEQKARRQGNQNGVMVFNKSRQRLRPKPGDAQEQENVQQSNA